MMLKRPFFTPEGNLFLTPLLAFAILFFQITSLSSPAYPEPEDQTADAESGIPWLESLEPEWGGHIRGRAMASWPDDESFYALIDSGTYYDGSADLRVKNKLSFGDWGYFDIHYEAVFSGGDTRESVEELRKLFAGLFDDTLFFPGSIEDDRRLFDLTSAILEEDDYILYHRLDRLSLTLLPEWGSVRMGRQAITWGNGLVFNPMDLFNPFAPTDIERDYKVGDDMVNVQVSSAWRGDFQFLYVPRRDPIDHNAKWSKSSLAGKFHFSVDTTEFDIMAAKHYEDYVAGLGSTGYLGDTAWRADATWTFVKGGGSGNDFLTLAANMDYSWVWWGKNFYGFVEVYYNGLGKSDDYADALTDSDIAERLGRGELFTLGRAYLSGHVRMELHPLFNMLLTVINNVGDPSGVIQPRITWDLTENSQLVAGANVSYGDEGSEFGGFKIPATDILIESPDSVFVWWTYYF